MIFWCPRFRSLPLPLARTCDPRPDGPSPRAGQKRHEPDDVWLRDALRHVAWSDSLTQTFGPDFAILVTDAQEMRPGNTPDERTMDFHNNAVGRQFAAARIPSGSLTMRVRKDPEITRHPDEVAHFGADR